MRPLTSEMVPCWKVIFSPPDWIFSWSAVGKPKAPTFRFKPERSRSWEIGYSFNFAPYWSRLRAGDMRLTY